MTKSEPSEITVRLYGPADLEAMAALFRASVRQIACRDYTQAQIEAWAPDNIDQEAMAIRHAGRPTWVAEIAGRVVGFADLEADGHLDFLYVHPGHQRRGVATSLLRQVERRALEQALSRLYSEVSITAKPFFERRGFRVVAAQTVVLRGQELVNFRMEKLLNSN